MLKKMFANSFKKSAAFIVIGGRNYFPKSSGNVYAMIEEKERGEGIVKIKNKLYYYLGSHKEEKHTRSAGKAAAGAIIGGVLTGGVGAIAGAAIGGRKKEDSTFWMDFADFETKQEFSVQVKPAKSSIREISNFRVANPADIGLDE